jgi:hypothetical protein
MPRDRLPLTAARVETRDGYRLLILEIGGRTANLTTEWKPALRAIGLVCVGDDLVDLTGERTYVSPDGTETVLMGHTDDPRVYSLFERFWHDRLKPGPVPIPD